VQKNQQSTLDQSGFSLGNQNQTANTTAIERSTHLNKAKQELLLTFVDQIFLEKEVENLKKDFSLV
jgi:hypothetical protein